MYGSLCSTAFCLVHTYTEALFLCILSVVKYDFTKLKCLHEPADIIYNSSIILGKGVFGHRILTLLIINLQFLYWPLE